MNAFYICIIAKNHNIRNRLQKNIPGAPSGRWGRFFFDIPVFLGVRFNFSRKNSAKHFSQYQTVRKAAGFLLGCMKGPQHLHVKSAEPALPVRGSGTCRPLCGMQTGGASGIARSAHRASELTSASRNSLCQSSTIRKYERPPQEEHDICCTMQVPYFTPLFKRDFVRLNLFTIVDRQDSRECLHFVNSKFHELFCIVRPLV